jgi:hypothetical protein
VYVQRWDLDAEVDVSWEWCGGGFDLFDTC